ncbi:uncharacterized protein BDV17DRAFT_288476 [Aspergillus undulatus]|uniref:uncharacterized protein n=1 Tax=Aspergillus undulatus TaxID=1810928 RepID=UPI003CCDBB37
MASDVTFEHLESVDATGDDFDTADEPVSAGDTSHLYTVRPLIISPPRQPPLQNNCYHSTVTRQWRIDEHETCNSCGRKPFLRWFYLCTEDTSGYTASIDQSGSLLSEWITEAILDGEYTVEERDLLIEQKLKVLSVCEWERNRAGAHFNANQGNQHQHGLNQPPGSNFNAPQIPSRPSRCHYRACYHCDRKLQERTLLGLNAVCDDPNVRPPSAWDLWETPVSDARVVRNLGLRAPRPPQPPPHSSQYVYVHPIVVTSDGLLDST